MGSRQWFAVYTFSHHEKSVSAHLANNDVQSFLPMYVTSRRRPNRCTVRLQLPVFPNYVFAHLRKCERVQVLRTPGVLGIVGTRHGATPIPDVEIESLRLGMSGHNVMPHPFLRIGDYVRVKHGAMAGLEGFLLREHNATRVVINVESIGRSMAIEIDAADIETISSRNLLTVQ